MHPSSLLSYYPTYEILDSVLSKGNYKKINLFVDLKNSLQTVYLEHAVKTIVENTLRSNYNDTSVFSSLLPFISFHKLYALKREIDVNFYFFFETGQSYYHKNLNKKYKISRLIDDLYGLSRDKRLKFTEVMQSNFMLIDKALNLMPDIKVFKMKNLDADFIPYYLTTRKLVGKENFECNLVYSNDHDLHQCCNDNTFIFSKARKNKRIITKDDVMTNFFKIKSDISYEYLPLLMSIIGDPGDDVEGIKGIGPKTVLKNFEEICELLNNGVDNFYDNVIDNLYDNVMSNKKIFNETGLEYKNKYINMIVEAEQKDNLISRNLKQVSFELLSREIDSPNSTEMLKRKEIILEILNNNRKATLQSLKRSLEMNRVFIQGDELEIIYHDILRKNRVDDL